MAGELGFAMFSTADVLYPLTLRVGEFNQAHPRAGCLASVSSWQLGRMIGRAGGDWVLSQVTHTCIDGEHCRVGADSIVEISTLSDAANDAKQKVELDEMTKAFRELGRGSSGAVGAKRIIGKSKPSSVGASASAGGPPGCKEPGRVRRDGDGADVPNSGLGSNLKPSKLIVLIIRIINRGWILHP